MRSDHVLFEGIESELPGPEELERSMARARRMRSAAVHEYLGRAWSWARAALRRVRTPADPAPQCC